MEAVDGHRSHLLQKSVLEPELVARVAGWAQAVVQEKLVEQAADVCISAPMLNEATAEVMLNTKIAIQYSWVQPGWRDLTDVPRRCARCRGSDGEDEVGSRGACCNMGRAGCNQCVGRAYVCTTCGVRYMRRYAYETGTGVTSIGRNRSQFKVLPFTCEMHEMAEVWTREAHTAQRYNNMVLVTYCGASMCAKCACDVPHKSKICGSIVGMHQDNAQGANGLNNSQAACSVNRTLNLGATRTLTMHLAQHLGGSVGSSGIPGTEVDFSLTHGSEFVLDTVDEVKTRRSIAQGDKYCSWKHGMVTPIDDDGISCGCIGRDVTEVRDVRLIDDVVIDPNFDAWSESASRGGWACMPACST